MKKSIIVLLCVIFFCWGCTEDSLQTVVSEDVSDQSEKSRVSDVGTDYRTVTVHICGEVYFPGVYTVYEGSRICDLIVQAGGFTEEADTEAINQAKEVLDGEQIYIPSVLESEDVTDAKGLIDINKASEDVLCTIPGIGSQRAKQIIEYREQNGNFKCIEDVMKISGIKAGMFEKIAPYITVS